MSNRRFPIASFRTIVTSIVLAATTAFAADLPKPPAAPSEPVTDVLHGTRVPDPYRNLEQVNAPATRAWLNAQADHAAQVLGHIQGRDAMAQRLQELSRASGDAVWGVLRMPGDRLYYLKRKVGEGQFKLMTRVGLDGPERVLVDPEARQRATGVPHAINYFRPSWDGRTLAYGMSAGGSEDASLHLMDIASGRPLREPIPRVHQTGVHWTPDSRSLSYNQLRALPKGAAETETYLDTTVYRIEPRRPGARPVALFGRALLPRLGLERLDVGEVMFAPDSRYMLARTTDTTVPEGRLYVARVADLGARSVPWRLVSSAADKITEIELRGDTVFLRTYAGAPRGRVLALRLADPVLARAVEVVPEPEVGVLKAFELGRDAVYSEVQQGFGTRVRRHAKGLPAQGVDVAPGLPGSIRVASDPAHAAATPWVFASTWTEPVRLFAVAADGSTRDTGLLDARRPPSTPELEVTQAMVASHDGAQVPLAILHRKGLVLDGSNPTLLNGYGAYGSSYSAGFDPRSIAWLERGGVLAYANVRGSGAFGDAWYRAGFKTSKPNTWKDGIACARWLIEQRYASPATLGISGGSAGGIFAGRAVTTAPELFAAAVFDVGVMDAVRAEDSANGITNISEFGSARDPVEFAALLEMSTYHQIRDATAYPSVLLNHGMNDPRVDVWHSAKAAARLQAASTSGKPILLRLDRQAGHGVGSTEGQRIGKQADTYSFLLWQFGKTALAP